MGSNISKSPVRFNGDTACLFSCKSYYLLIYETRENAAAAAGDLPAAAVRPTMAKYWSDYWSKWLNSKVLYSQPGEIIFLIRKEFVENKELWFVIIGEKVGWIITYAWLNMTPYNDDL